MEDDRDLLVLEKSNKTGWILLIIILLLVIGGLVFYYFMYFSNPVYVIGKGLKDYSDFNLRQEEINENAPIRIRGGIELDYHSNDEEVQKVYDVFNDLNVLYSIDGDLIKDEYSLKISSKYQEEDLINGRLYMNSEAEYLYLEGIFDKYIKVLLDEDDESSSSDAPEEDVLKLVDGLKDAVINSLTKDDFKREKETITYNDKKMSVYKNYVTYNENNCKRITDGALNGLKDNTEFMNTLKKYSTEEEINEMFMELEESLLLIKGEVIVYTKGLLNEFVQFVIKFDAEEEWFKFEDDAKGKMKITFFSDNLLTETVVQTNSLYNYTISSTITDSDDIKSTLTSTLIVENIEKIDKVDDSKAINLEDLSDDDYLKIMENIGNNKGLNKLIESFNDLLTFNEDFSITA